MSYLKSTILALATACALSTAALAQGEGTALRDSQVMIVMADGRMMTRTVTDRAMLDSMVQRGRQVTAGQALVMAGGKLYIVEDYRMADGKMMSDLLMSAN